MDWLKRKKRLNKIKAVSIALIVLVGVVFGFVWQAALLILFFWLGNELLWSDHIFYDPGFDYDYDLDSDFKTDVTIDDGVMLVKDCPLNNQPDTWMMAIKVQGKRVSGRFYDPYITLRCGEKEQRQYLERGVSGLRYVNLSSFSDEINSRKELEIIGSYCNINNKSKLYGFCNPDYTQKRIMIIAPHADDAEIAAFGLYSHSEDTHIVTLTAGEVEMEDYYHVYDNSEKASTLKGQLRAHDSIAIPLWGGVKQDRCIQLGYFCKRLKDMHDNRDEAFVSLTAGVKDTRVFRDFNSRKLSSDDNGKPTWNNLVQDLTELLDEIQPEVIVTPNPEIDSHQDHIYATLAVREAVKQSSALIETELMYANHYKTTDMFPFGNAHTSAALPPLHNKPSKLAVFSYTLNEETQKRKALSLDMMHDLRKSLGIKKAVRKFLFKKVLKRDFYRYGNESYFYRAIKNQEVFTYVKNQEV